MTMALCFSLGFFYCVCHFNGNIVSHLEQSLMERRGWHTGVFIINDRQEYCKLILFTLPMALGGLVLVILLFAAAGP